MSLFQAALLGVIQGFTEFLPVSSSGHLIFLPRLFHWADQGQAFDVVVHLGTLLAVIVYFRVKLWGIITNFFRKGGDPVQKRLGWFLIFSLFPAAVVGFIMSEVLNVEFRSTLLIGINFIVWGIVLFLADRFSQKYAAKTLETMNKKMALCISLAQVLALLPGTSRSGITMTAGLFGKLDKTSAAEFSFLMSIPVIAMAGALKVFELMKYGLGDLTFSLLVVGFVASSLSGLLAISTLLKIIKKWSFTPFVVYRIVVGVLILVFLT